MRAALRARIGALSAAELDTARWLNPGAARWLGEGRDSAAWRVGAYVVRVPKHARAWAALEREAALLPALAARGVPFVTPTAEVVRGEDGALVAAVHRYVDGAPLTRARLAALRGARRERLARQLAAFLGALHAVPLVEARALGVAEPELWDEVYAPLTVAVRPHVGAATAAGLDVLGARFVADAGERRAVRALVHGDIAGAHLLVDADGALAGVIDFGDAMIGDPALDFAGLLNDAPRAFLERVLAHYPQTIDAGARERAAWYIAVAPLYAVREGVERGDAALLARGRRELASRVARAVAAGAGAAGAAGASGAAGTVH